MSDERKDAFLDMLHGLLKLLFEPIFHICLNILHVCCIFFNRSKEPVRLPKWLSPDHQSPSSDDRVLTPTNISGRQQGSTRQIFLSTLFQQLETKSRGSLESKEARRQIEGR